MYHLRLCKGLSYCNANGTIQATRQQPDIYIPDKATADAAIASGFFTLVGVDDTEDSPTEETPAPAFDAEVLAELDLAELTDYADKNGISLEGVPATKADVLEAISVANGGSYTMLDLMRE